MMAVSLFALERRRLASSPCSCYVPTRLFASSIVIDGIDQSAAIERIFIFAELSELPGAPAGAQARLTGAGPPG